MWGLVWGERQPLPLKTTFVVVVPSLALDPRSLRKVTLFQGLLHPTETTGLFC